MNNNEWMDIPGYSRYQVNSKSEVRRKKDGFVLTQFEKETTKGTYLCVAVYNDRKHRETAKGVHVLVCLAFHGLPPSKKHTDVNHKDGNKHHNYPDNVEWSTRSDNVLHAFRTRLSQASQQIEITDVLSGEKHHVSSLFELASFMNVPRIADYRIFNHELYGLYKGRYKLKRIGRYVRPRMDHALTIACYDYVTGNLFIYDSLTALQEATGINKITASNRVRKKDYRLIRGFVLKSTGDPTPFPVYTSDEVTASVELGKEFDRRMQLRKDKPPR